MKVHLGDRVEVVYQTTAAGRGLTSTSSEVDSQKRSNALRDKGDIGTFVLQEGAAFAAYLVKDDPGYSGME